MPDLSFGMWVLVAMLGFAGISVLAAVALYWAGSSDEADMANDWWKDV